MTVYTINHTVSDDLETWLIAQPNFISFERQNNNSKIVVEYNHTLQESKDFKRALGKRISLNDDNINTEEIKYYLKGVVQILINKGVITMQDIQNQFPELFD